MIVTQRCLPIGCWVVATCFLCTNVFGATGSTNSHTLGKAQFPWSAIVDGPPIRQVVALNNVLSSNDVDNAPREPQRRNPLVNFNDLSGWNLLLHGDMQATARRSREALLSDDYTLRVDFISGGHDTKGNYTGYLELAPPKPIEIITPFDAMSIWKKWKFTTNGVHYTQDANSAQVYLYVRDAKGDIFKLTVGSLPGAQGYMPEYWGMAQGTIDVRPWKGDPGRAQTPRGMWFTLEGGPNYKSFGKTSKINFPVNLLSIALFPPLKYGKEAGVECLYLDSLSCYEMPKTAYKPRDTEPLRRVGTRGIVPIPREACRTAMRRDGKTTFFTCQSGEGTLEYRYTPKQGDLSDLMLRQNDGKWVTPFANGGLYFCPGDDNRRIVSPPYTEPVSAKLLRLSTKADTLTAAWQYVVDGVKINVTYHFRIEDKSLTLTIDEPTGKVYRLDFGHPKYDGTKQLVDVPYLTFSCCENSHGNQPFAMLLDNKTFLFTMLDWTVSDATAAYGPFWDENPPRINGGCVYLRMTDGRRNPFHERIVLTASDDYLEVLPNLPNPSGQRKLVSDYFFFVNGGIPYFPFEVMHRFGVENILYFTFGDTWVGANEYGFFRDKLKSDVDKEMPKWLAFMKSLGYRHGGYSDFLAIDPANKYFRDDAIVLGPDRAFMEDILNSYRPKIPYALDIFREIEPEIRAKYQLAGYYFDTYSAFGSTEIYDYDATAWGAGKFRTGAEAIAKMMDLTKKSHTISFSEGKRTYEYAGYVDVDYGTLGGWDPAKYPMLPAFNLYQIHSKTAMIGGFGQTDPPKTEAPRNYGQRRAFLIAYGMGDMQITFPGVGYAGAPNSFSGFLKNYFLFYAFQRSCMPANVENIRYYDDAGAAYDTSAAIKRDLVKLGRLRVAYDNGLEVWVNYSSKEDWRVSCQGQEYLLPPYGFVFAQGDKLLGFAALRDGVKLEYISCPDYVYLDTHGREATVDGVTADGEVLIKQDRKKGLWIIPTGGYLGYVPPEPSPDFKSHSPQRGCRLVRFTPESLGMDFDGIQTVATAFNDQGKTAGNFPIIYQGKAIELHPSDKYQKYRVAPAAGK